MRLRADPWTVPVLMFHSVGLEDSSWVWSYLSESVDSFEQKLERLARRGFHSVFWKDVVAHMKGELRLPPNAIMLTFDDGYLDNWVYAFPLLRKYGFVATIFVTPEFIDPSEAPRMTMDDVKAGHCETHDLEAAGFLNWAEMRAMERSGLVDIQSHAQTHTWHFTGPRVVDVHRPRQPQPYPWLFWNARPERKPYYLNENQETFRPWGYPVLEHAKALLARRFIPDEQATARLPEVVASRGGADFFAGADWWSQLQSFITDAFPDGALPGTYETVGERRERVRGELFESKQCLEEGLNKTVDFICWPGGGNDSEVRELAQEVGYKGWTLGSMEHRDQRNRPGADPLVLRRIGTVNAIMVRGRRMAPADADYQMQRIESHRGSAWARMQLRGRQLRAVVQRGLA